MTYPDRIRQWVRLNFSSTHTRIGTLERITQDLIDVATGNRPGNRFEREALARIFPETVAK